MSPRKKTGQFIKSADTDVSVDRSVEEIKALVRKYGAAGFGISENYETGQSIIDLVLPDLPGEKANVPLRIPVNVERVYHALYPGFKDPKKHDESVKTQRREQAERVAWRHVFYVIEVALMTAQLGGRRISESLMADVMVVGDAGRSERMADYLTRTGGALGPGVRALLPAPREEERPA